MSKVFKYGDNIDTDVILPGKYLSISSPKKLAEVCMEGCDDNFVQNVSKGDVIVAGENFGCGSSREHAPIAIKVCGVSCVIAKSFARIFFRNSINIGLLVVESKYAVENISGGDEITIDLIKGVINNNTTNNQYMFKPYPTSIMEIIDAGGVKNQMIQSIKQTNQL